MTVVYLIRHATSEFRRELPEAEWPLSAAGQAQAEQLVPHLAGLGIDCIYSSPYVRAVATVQPFADRHRLDIRIDERLAERRLAQEPLREGFLEALKRTWEDHDFALEGGESSRQCQKRVVEGMHDIAERQNGRTIAVSSHGNTIGLFLHHLDPAFGFADWERMRNPDVFRVRRNDNVLTWDRQFQFPN